jgi:G6PDH family F420-dependent oxidoreductase
MAEVGFFISSEEHGPRAMVRFAQMAEEAGFRAAVVSDHYHPWIDSQGESPFIWGVIGGIAATTDLRVTTGVTCPTVRIHPAVIAQAAATSSLMLDGRFALGVGSGEALNEHILGDRWPPADIRLSMLEEAIEVMRQLWQGDVVSHHGPHYTVENARIYSCPSQPPPVIVSAFGPKALSLAARIGDGLVTTSPEPDAVRDYRRQGGEGPTLALAKVCWAEDEQTARKTAFELWKTTSVPGELNQELPMPAHFEQAAQNVTEDMVADTIPCGPDPERHAALITAYLEAGFDEVYVSQIGTDQAGFLEFYNGEVQRRLSL